MPTAVEEFADRATEAIFSTRAEKHARKEVMRKSDVRAILLRIAAEHFQPRPPRAPRRPVSAKPEPFGDRRVIPPPPEMVEAYSASIGYPLHGQKWRDHYEAKDWKIGSVRMKDWQAAVRNWKANRWGLGTIAKGTQPPDEPRDYTKI